MKLPRYYGETSNGWVISEPFTMTNRAKYAFKIERGSQISLIENRKGDFLLHVFLRYIDVAADGRER